MRLSEHTFRQLDDAFAYAESIVDTVREPLIVLNRELQVEAANRSFYKTFQITPPKTESRFIFDLGGGQWNIPRLRILLEQILPHDTSFENFPVDHEFPGIGRKSMLLNVRRICRKDQTELILLAIEDITERTRAEDEVRASEAKYRRLFETAHDGILILDGETGKIIDVNPPLLDLLGYTRTEILEKDLWQLGLFKDISASQSAFHELQEKGYLRYDDLPLQTNDGRFCEVEFVGNIYEVNGKRVIPESGVKTTISERERFELVDFAEYVVDQVL
jgi:PAS domain S-box-containing protein